MRTTYLEYYKTILSKVSFDHQLFRKEYRKALSQLPPAEVNDLNAWLRSHGLQPNAPPASNLIHIDTDEYSSAGAIKGLR